MTSEDTKSQDPVPAPEHTVLVPSVEGLRNMEDLADESADEELDQE